ncbi:hypothetical protein HAX54_043554, partial [Datura stramonium]|nr:hypothetical protein [Datura stramonium]
ISNGNSVDNKGNKGPPPPTNVDEEAVGWEVKEEILKEMFASILLNSEGLEE